MKHSSVVPGKGSGICSVRPGLGAPSRRTSFPLRLPNRPSKTTWFRYWTRRPPRFFTRIFWKGSSNLDSPESNEQISTSACKEDGSIERGSQVWSYIRIQGDRDVPEHLHLLIRQALVARDSGDVEVFDALIQAIKNANRERIRMIDLIRTLDQT